MANKKRRKPNTRPRSAPGQAARAADEVDGGARGDDLRPSARTTPAGRTAPRRRPEPPVHVDAASARTRAEKKELARQQREAVRRRMQRQRRVRQGAYVAVLVVAIAIGVFVFTNGSGKSGSNDTNANLLPGTLTTDAPWPTNTAQVQARAQAIHLPSHSNVLALHHHVDVQIFIHGQPTTIPANVGIDDGRYIASIHTHTADGIVHIESSKVADFTLQQFFDVWGVRFTQSCIGGYCDQGADKLQVFQDGKDVTGSFGDVPLNDHSVIVITYGTPSEVPRPVPSTFDFSSVG